MSWELDVVEDRLKSQELLLHDISRGLRQVQRPPGKAKPERRPGSVVLRSAVSELLRPMTTSQGGRVTFEKDAFEVARSLYIGDERLQDWIRRAAVSPATTTTTGFAAELVSTATIDFLSGDDAASGFSALAARTLNVPVEGNVKIAARPHPATLSASWTTEGAPKAVYALSLSSIQLTANKITSVSAWTDEISLWSVPSIEAVVADSLRRDINGLLDSTAFGTAAATGAAPAGLFNGATAVTATASGTAAEKMFADLVALGSAVRSGAPDARVVYVMNPAQALRLGLTAPAFADTIISGYMPTASVGAIDLGSIVTLMGPLTFLSSPNATLHMSDTPSAIVPVGGTAISAPVVSAFQANLVALRSTLYCSWKTRRSGATALIGTVGW